MEYLITLYNNSSADTPDLVCTITDATIGFTQAVTLASGANAPYTVPFTIPADFVGDDFANTASVTCSPVGFPNVYTDEASWSIELFQPSINLTKSAETLSKAGDPVAYTITLFNTSSADTPDLVCMITDATIGFSEGCDAGLWNERCKRSAVHHSCGLCRRRLCEHGLSDLLADWLPECLH